MVVELSLEMVLMELLVTGGDGDCGGCGHGEDGMEEVKMEVLLVVRVGGLVMVQVVVVVEVRVEVSVVNLFVVVTVKVIDVVVLAER